MCRLTTPTSQLAVYFIVSLQDCMIGAKVQDGNSQPRNQAAMPLLPRPSAAFLLYFGTTIKWSMAAFTPELNTAHESFVNPESEDLTHHPFNTK